MAMLISLTNTLPHELVVDILTRLPMKSLLRFRCVLSTWKKFLYSDSTFIKRHLDHSIKNYQHIMLKSWYLYSIHDYNVPLVGDVLNGVKLHQPFKTPWYKVWGSCDGLFLISTSEDKECVWNASTGEYMVLPELRLKPHEKPKDGYRRFIYSFTVYGFGYDKISEEYKVVRFDVFEDIDDEIGYGAIVKVCTLHSDSWRRVDVIWPYSHVNGQGGKFVNGALHWVADRYVNPNDDSDDDDDEGLNDIGIAEKIRYKIVSFNLEDEKCMEIPQPDYDICDADDIYKINVEVLDGCLCILCSLSLIEEEVWVMKEYGVKESWTKRFIINKQGVIQSPNQYVKGIPIKFTKNGKVLIEVDETFIVVFDPVKETTKRLRIPGMTHYFSTHTYVDSLISLKTGTYVWQQQLEMRADQVEADERAAQLRAKWIADRESRQAEEIAQLEAERIAAQLEAERRAAQLQAEGMADQESHKRKAEEIG